MINVDWSSELYKTLSADIKTYVKQKIKEMLAVTKNTKILLTWNTL